MKAYIALGSNLQNPQQQIQQAIAILQQHSQLELVQTSSLYQSEAMIIAGTEAQADYINAVVLLETPLAAHDLLHLLQQIEHQQGRVRGKKWSARTLDLDILLYDDNIIISDDLIIPHPNMCERNFVLYPLAEISPVINIPLKGYIKDVLSRLTSDGLVKLGSKTIS
ncbi:MAG: 2-amino-4-hydroxy-6-hydroxymethyldihydropteridine diphosphokinase [Pseudomonadota bacterium]